MIAMMNSGPRQRIATAAARVRDFFKPLLPLYDSNIGSYRKTWLLVRQDAGAADAGL